MEVGPRGDPRLGHGAAHGPAAPSPERAHAKRTCGACVNAKDPVRVSFDAGRGNYRVAYWESGTPGLGKRRFERHGTEAAAGERANTIRAALLVAAGPVPRDHITVGEVARDWIAAISEGTKPGTLKAYRSDVNCYILPSVGRLAVSDLSIQAFAAVVDGVEAKRLKVQTLNGAIRTLNALTSWAEPRGLFPEGAWGTDVRRRSVVKAARRRLRSSKQSGPISVDMVPSFDDVAAFADEMEKAWPGRGASFVRIMAASGLRISEALGLSVEMVDVENCTIRVERQADRLAPWPAVGPPKDDETRTVLCWHRVQADLRSVVEAADEDGWLFPPFEPERQKWWTNRLTELLRVARSSAGWVDRGWTNHWLRHHYASFSLAPPPLGFGLPATVVQESLGHHSLSVTLNTYTQHVADPVELMRAATS